MVFALFPDIGLRKQTENAFIAQFNLTSVNSISAIEIIPPVKNYSDEELLKILDQNKIDGVMVVALQDFWTTNVYIPPSFKTKGSASSFGNSTFFESQTQQYGGYHFSRPTAKFEIRLFDKKSSQVAWIATSTTKGDVFSDYNTLLKSLAKEVVKKLIKEKHH